MEFSTNKYSAQLMLKGTVLGVALMVALSACSNVKSSLGLNKRAPDEFSVVSKAPLILPPDYNLRPPRPGAPRPTELAPIADARAAVFGSGKEKKPKTRVRTAQQMAIAALDQNKPPAKPKSAGELALLGQAGSDATQANIRSTIRLETTGVSDKPQSLADRLLFWKDKTDEGTIIDAGKEAARLKKLSDEGKPASGSPAPVIRRKKQTLLENVE